MSGGGIDLSGQVTLAWTSERTLRISVVREVSHAGSEHVRLLADRLRLAHVPAALDVVPAYTTVTLSFDPLRVERSLAEQAVGRVLAESNGREPAAARRITIPVCYGDEFGPDLVDVAVHHGCGVDEIVRRHIAAVYHVAFLGFSPGFAYLSGLPESLHTPRLGRPRSVVPAGSVAIGGEQTGVYPHATPGGWRLIGRTPLVMFDASRPEPALLAPGDEVSFTAVDRATFERLQGERGS